VGSSSDDKCASSSGCLREDSAASMFLNSCSASLDILSEKRGSGGKRGLVITMTEAVNALEGNGGVAGKTRDMGV